jgi:hypothetical protein
VLKALVVLIAVTAQPVHAPRWPARAVIDVWVDAHGAPAGTEALVDRALATWTRAAAGEFVLRKSPTREAARLQVWFAQADGIYGEAAPKIDRSTNTITSAEVLITGDVPGDPLQQRIVIYLTALHEIGHALGLPHTAVFDDIMYSFRRPDDGERYFGAYRRRLRTAEDIGTERANGLSPADLAALRALYPPT